MFNFAFGMRTIFGRCCRCCRRCVSRRRKLGARSDRHRGGSASLQPKGPASRPLSAPGGFSLPGAQGPAACYFAMRSGSSSPSFPQFCKPLLYLQASRCKTTRFPKRKNSRDNQAQNPSRWSRLWPLLRLPDPCPLRSAPRASLPSFSLKLHPLRRGAARPPAHPPHGEQTQLTSPL